MASGTPVITSNAASLPEVVGDAGIRVSPYDVDALANAIITVLGSVSLREKMREKGLNRAARFTWERCAAETARVYEAVLSKTGVRNPVYPQAIKQSSV
jgi:glycosyltransferase involved in cell wall biosynthesis